MRARSSFAVAVVLLTLGAAAPGCTGQNTGVVLTVLTDLRVPEEMDMLQLKVTVDGSSSVVDVPIPLGPTATTLPGTFGIYSEGGALVTIALTGSVRTGPGARSSVVRTARLTLVQDNVLSLALSLVRDCVGVTCESPNDTCIERGACVDNVVDPSTLPDFDTEDPFGRVDCGDYLDGEGNRLSRNGCPAGRECVSGRCIRVRSDGGVPDGEDGPGPSDGGDGPGPGDGPRDTGDGPGPDGRRDQGPDGPTCSTGVSCANGERCSGDCIDGCCYPNGCTDCSTEPCVGQVCNASECCIPEPFCPNGPACDSFTACSITSQCIDNCCVPNTCPEPCDGGGRCLPGMLCYDGCCGPAPQCLTGPPCDAANPCGSGSSCGADNCCAPDACQTACDQVPCPGGKLCDDSGCCIPNIACPSGPSWDRWRSCPGGFNPAQDHCCYPQGCPAPCTAGPCGSGQVCFGGSCCGAAPACSSGFNCDIWNPCPNGHFCSADSCCYPFPDGGPPDGGPPDMITVPDGPPPFDMTAAR